MSERPQFPDGQLSGLQSTPEPGIRQPPSEDPTVDTDSTARSAGPSRSPFAAETIQTARTSDEEDAAFSEDSPPSGTGDDA